MKSIWWVCGKWWWEVLATLLMLPGQGAMLHITLVEMVERAVQVTLSVFGFWMLHTYALAKRTGAIVDLCRFPCYGMCDICWYNLLYCSELSLSSWDKAFDIQSHNTSFGTCLIWEKNAMRFASLYVGHILWKWSANSTIWRVLVPISQHHL